MEMMTWATVACFCWGAIWGSFLNVVIYRVPRGLSVVRPGSHCMSCNTPIAWYHNIPIVSWLLLRGQCASCKTGFSIRYALVELVTACLTAGLWIQLVQSAGGDLATIPIPKLLIAWFFLFVFVADLVVIALIDFDTMRIPDVLSLSPIPMGLACALFAGDITGVSLLSSVFGLLIGGGSLWVVTYGYYWLTGREGMGLGDYRLMALVGAFLGWASILFVLMASAIQGLLYALFLHASGRSEGVPMDEDEEAPSTENAPDPVALRHAAVPFGPFIVLGALEWLVFHDYILHVFHLWAGIPAA